MGILVEMAEKAYYSEKKTSQNFKSTAHKSMYALVAFAIATFGVGYTFNGIWIILPIILMILATFQAWLSNGIAGKIRGFEEKAAAALQEKNNSEKIRFTEIIQAYGETLSASAPLPGKVADESKLPHKKRLIKEAIIWALHQEQDAESKIHLKTAYGDLVRWQHGVGASDQDLNAAVGEGTLDVALLAGSGAKQDTEKKDWNTMVQIETETLKRELKDASIR